MVVGAASRGGEGGGGAAGFGGAWMAVLRLASVEGVATFCSSVCRVTGFFRPMVGMERAKGHLQTRKQYARSMLPPDVMNRTTVSLAEFVGSSGLSDGVNVPKTMPVPFAATT